ncbi:hypothetical protein [Deinococcus sp. Marseille-Q6407]|uniref:hypothetical protein n=1 Tax=Deinococcus sp. Marseille-Q6407 TaxID=2969223 RepID=UPI0021BE648F|nr:hypothetical protein [Deinococcus sp. Marseille-Q6407]
MQHFVFPSNDHAQAFIQDVQAAGISPAHIHLANVRPVETTEQTTVVDGTPAMTPGEGATSGIGAGALVGAAAGIAVTIATGGLGAVPLILGFSALGAATGGVSGAVEGAVETATAGPDGYLDETRRHQIVQHIQEGGQSLAVDDVTNTDLVNSLAVKHGGQLV